MNFHTAFNKGLWTNRFPRTRHINHIRLHSDHNIINYLFFIIYPSYKVFYSLKIIIPCSYPFSIGVDLFALYFCIEKCKYVFFREQLIKSLEGPRNFAKLIRALRFWFCSFQKCCWIANSYKIDRLILSLIYSPKSQCFWGL